jgi:hypothetical protein
MTEPQETHIGDGLYASHDGYQIKLRAPRSEGDHEVFLDDRTLGGLFAWIEKTYGVTVSIHPKDKPS